MRECSRRVCVAPWLRGRLCRRLRRRALGRELCRLCGRFCGWLLTDGGGVEGEDIWNRIESERL